MIGATLLLIFLHGGLAVAAPSEPSHLKVKADQMLKHGQLDEAIILYQRVLEKEGRFANAYYNLATAYYLRNEFEKATKNLEAFVRLRPNDGEALYNLGCLKLRTGAFQEACRCFLRAQGCPCAHSISRKIKEALHFTKDLQNQNPETQKLVAYLLTGSPEAF